MALINFPSNPIVNQVYKHEDGTSLEKAFIFKAGQTGASDGYWSGFPTTGFGPASAVEINASTDSIKYIAPDQLALSDYIDEDKLQARLDNDSPIFRAGRKNLLINGCMRVWQRSELITISGSENGYFASDRWYSSTQGSASGSMTLDKGNIAYEGRTLAANKITSSLDVSTGWFMSQGIEDVNTVKGKRFKASFLFRSDVAVSMRFTVQYRDSVGSATNSVLIVSSAFEVPGDSTLHLYEFDVNATVAVPNGSNTCTVVGLLQESYATIVTYTTEFQFEEVTTDYPTVTRFEYRHITEELLLCKRYFQKVGPILVAGYASTGSRHSNIASFSPEMRIVPTDSTFTGNSGNATSFAVTPTKTLATYSILAISTGMVSWNIDFTTFDAEL